jgi:acyl-CoA synthetase (AMP-forming)/AMP-acid ligase II
MMNLGTILPRHARYRPDHLAVVFEHHRLSYSEMNARVNRLSRGLLKLGIHKGDKLAMLLPNSLEMLDIYWACAKTCIVAVPLSPLLRDKGLSGLLADSDAVGIVTTQAMIKHLEPLRDQLPHLKHAILIDAQTNHPPYLSYGDVLAEAHEPPCVELGDQDLFNIIYSSGTTGQPKGIMHTHYGRAMYCMRFAAAFRMTPESVILHTGSLVFNGAFLTLMPAFFQGATYVLHHHFDVEQLVETIHREQVTHIMMVPSQIVAMLHSPHFDPAKMKSLEMLLTVGAPLHLEQKEELNRHLPGVFYELYGLTEGFSTVLDKTMYAARPASVGAPLPFNEIKIVDDNGQELPTGQVGEIVGRGPGLMAGYYKRPDLTAQVVREGWLYSGDLGYLDEDGYLFLVDRKKDLIISGGVNVYPRDIEEVIVQHPNVVEAAVFGVPDEKWGEVPVAAVILKEKSAGLTQEHELLSWINQHIEARYQRVSAVLVQDEFPRSTAGKTLKRVMRDVFLQERPDSI